MSVAKLEASLDLNGKGFKKSIDDAKSQAKGFDATIRNTGREVENLNKVPWFQQGRKNVTDFRSTLEMIKMAFRTGWQMGEGLDQIVKFFSGELLSDKLGRAMTWVADSGNRLGESMRRTRQAAEAVNAALVKQISLVAKLQDAQQVKAINRAAENEKTDADITAATQRRNRAEWQAEGGMVPGSAANDDAMAAEQSARRLAARRVQLNEAAMAATQSLLADNMQLQGGARLTPSARAEAQKEQIALEDKIAEYAAAIEKDKKAITLHTVQIEAVVAEEKLRQIEVERITRDRIWDENKATSERQAAEQDAIEAREQANKDRIWEENKATSERQARTQDQREALQSKIKPVTVSAFADSSAMGAYRGESVARQIDMHKAQIDALRENTKALKEFNAANPQEY